MFNEIIPASVMDTIENNDLLIYSYGLRLSKHGPVLHIGAQFPHQKNKWDPLDAEENRDLRMDVKKELRKLGYKSKVRSFVHPKTREKDVNDFRIRVLLRVGRDIDRELVEKLKEVRRQARRAKKRAARHARLGSRL